MRRFLFSSALLASTLLIALPASAKFAVDRAEVCGLECMTIDAGPLSPYLYLPTIDSGRRSERPASASLEPRYEVVLHLRPGDNQISVEYLPVSGYLHVAEPAEVLRGPGGTTFGQLPHRGWFQLEGYRSANSDVNSELNAWRNLVEGIAPIPGSASPNGSIAAARTSDLWPYLVAAGAALAFAFIALVARRRWRVSAARA